MNAEDHRRLSRIIAHALRHKPENYGLTLDKDGWVPLNDLVAALARSREWRDLAGENIRAMAASADKQRYEIDANRIRALYGHSLADKIEKVPAAPPCQLYHGTTPTALTAIRRHGLRPMRRQYVHLSPDTETAADVARRRTGTPIIIAVQAGAAYADGIVFYRANEQVWLSECVAARYLNLPGER